MSPRTRTRSRPRRSLATSAKRRRAEDQAVVDGRQRVVIERVRPEVNGGRFRIKRTVGESVRVTAWVHADGHDVLAAVIRYRPVARADREEWLERAMQPLGNDEWAASFVIEHPDDYEYTVQAWVDRFASWRHELAAKVGARQDVSSELLEGAALLRSVAARARTARVANDARWIDEQADLIGGDAEMEARAQAALDDRLARMARQFTDRAHATTFDRVLGITVDRERARFGAWYEMFPRSWGPDPARSATFAEAEAHLPRIAGMGFDVVYLPPIHPIGVSFRKGRGNALRAEPGDPGSPWAIGSAAGGHKAVDPGLGTLDDFDRFVREARRLGLEVALDLAYQCSPDHPYVTEHPEWFRHRPDGTIKYAENPPKKYQDIYPFDFECEAWASLWEELKSVVEFWIAHGVSIFRVDNPHTKPFRFWEWLIGDIRKDHPEAIFLAEAFTRPKVMYYLAKLGFSQSYTYFTWRNSKDELTEYFTELTGTEVADFFRPNLFANTPDILHAYLQQGGPPAFRIRLILAAMLGATYGIYSGFELCENRAVPGTEEYLGSEKYQYRHWEWNRPENIRDLVTVVNRIRREESALHSNDGLVFCQTDNPHLLAFSKVSADRSSALFVIVNLDYTHMQHGWVQVPVDRLRLPTDHAYDVVDQLDGARYTWKGEWNYVRLDPLVSVAHVLKLPVAAPDVVSAAGEALARVLPRQRWFAGKARTIEKTAIMDWSSAGAMPGGLMMAIARVEYADGGEDRYFTPFAILPEAGRAPETGDTSIVRAGGSAVVDALEDDAACQALLGVLLEGRSTRMHHGTARAAAYGSGLDAAGLRIRRSTAEQSNSCVVFGTRYVLKLLRRLEAGPNPELEISRFLAARGFTGIPPLVASLEYVVDGAEPASLALVQGFVANDGSGWDHALADVRRLSALKTAGLETGAIGFLPAAATLGRRTAELHLALASGDSDPAFAPEELTTEHVEALVARLQEDAERSLTLLAERLESLPESAHGHARAVLEARPLLGAHIRTFATAPAGSLRTRVHGDYHLGQVLAVGDDFVLIDFEGEPARSLAARRRKQSPLKDVAGMLRSFGYAAQTAILESSSGRDDAASRLQRRARIWEASVSAAFLKSYRETIAGAGLAPADDRGFSQLLDVFLLEKALYELEYELASRPLWVGVPLAGILRILSVPDEPATAP